MKKKWMFRVALLAAIAAGAWYYTRQQEKPKPPEILKVSVSKGPITETVQAMGIIEPRRRVNVGAQVSGVVKELYVDFNSVVTEGQLLAEIESDMYEVQVQVQEANVARQKLDIETQGTQLADLKRQLARVKELFAKDLQNRVQLDAAELAVTMREAQITSAKKQLVQGEAALSAARLNLSYTKIYSPIDGVVVNRSVDKGQTVQASLRTPNFFLLAAPFETLRLTAGVDEADISRVRRGMPVKFKVGTFGQELFDGVVDTVRLNASRTNEVVTYPVWIRVENEDLKLRPGMTATVFIEVSNAVETATRIPNEALKFRPTRAVYAALGVTAPATDTVRQVDLDAERVIEPSARRASGADDEVSTIDELFAPMPRANAMATVWRYDESSREFTSIPVRVGVSDGSMTELLSGDVNVGDQLVTRVVLPQQRSSLVGEQRKAGLPQTGPGPGGGRGGPGGGGGGGRGGGSR
jgi:HlyD family secretion protein